MWYWSWVSKTNPQAIHSLGYSRGVAAICALTDQGVLYSVLRKGTNTAWEILLFFIDLENKLKEKEGKNFDNYWKHLFIIFDNASIHTTLEVATFFWLWGFQAMTLP